MLAAEIIAVGSELLTPDKTDTNSLWLTEKLNDIGIDVKLKTIVGDDSARLEETIRDALKRSDIVITTGGLGPTEDDITRTVAANAADKELVFDQTLCDELIEKFKRFGRPMPEINKRQAYVIKGARVLGNPNGSAPGMYLEDNGRRLAILPGPPREMKPMFEGQVLPELSKLAGQIYVKRRIIKVTGMGESAVDEQIAPIYTAHTGLQTTILFNRSEVEIHLAAVSENEATAQELVDDVSQKIAEKLGIAVFSTFGESIEEVVGKLMVEQGKTLAVAESCTGGLISRRLTDIAGSSEYFIEGAITYANEAKVRTLGVLPEMLEKHGAVSPEVAEAMAQGIRQRAQTDYGISVTGIAGPGGGTPDKPVGLVYIGYSDKNKTKSLKISLPGDRYLIRWRSSQAALDYLRRKLLKAI